MNRIFSSILALAMCASLGAVANAGIHLYRHSPQTRSMHHHCANGQTWVHGYTRNGKHVKGYCRK